MTKTITSLFVVILMTTVFGAAQDVRYNFDKTADFGAFKTYKWVNLKDAPQIDSIRDKEIKQNVDSELATKGLSKTDADSADLYVGYQAAIGSEKQFTSYNTGWGNGPGWGGGWYGGGGGGMTTGQTSTIYTGQLALDMYDSKNRDLIWRGVVSKTIDPEAKPEKQEKNLNKAITKLLKNYPPEKK